VSGARQGCLSGGLVPVDLPLCRIDVAVGDGGDKPFCPAIGLLQSRDRRNGSFSRGRCYDVRGRLVSVAAREGHCQGEQGDDDDRAHGTLNPLRSVHRHSPGCFRRTAEVLPQTGMPRRIVRGRERDGPTWGSHPRRDLREPIQPFGLHLPGSWPFTLMGTRQVSHRSLAQMVCHHVPASSPSSPAT